MNIHSLIPNISYIFDFYHSYRAQYHRDFLRLLNNTVLQNRHNNNRDIYKAMLRLSDQLQAIKQREKRNSNNNTNSNSNANNVSSNINHNYLNQIQNSIFCLHYESLAFMLFLQKLYWNIQLVEVVNPLIECINSIYHNWYYQLVASNKITASNNGTSISNSSLVCLIGIDHSRFKLLCNFDFWNELLKNDLLCSPYFAAMDMNDSKESLNRRYLNYISKYGIRLKKFTKYYHQTFIELRIINSSHNSSDQFLIIEKNLMITDYSHTLTANSMTSKDANKNNNNGNNNNNSNSNNNDSFITHSAMKKIFPRNHNTHPQIRLTTKSLSQLSSYLYNKINFHFFNFRKLLLCVGLFNTKDRTCNTDPTYIQANVNINRARKAMQYKLRNQFIYNRCIARRLKLDTYLFPSKDNSITRFEKDEKRPEMGYPCVIETAFSMLNERLAIPKAYLLSYCEKLPLLLTNHAFNRTINDKSNVEMLDKLKDESHKEFKQLIDRWGSMNAYLSFKYNSIEDSIDITDDNDSKSGDVNVSTGNNNNNSNSNNNNVNNGVRLDLSLNLNPKFVQTYENTINKLISNKPHLMKFNSIKNVSKPNGKPSDQPIEDQFPHLSLINNVISAYFDIFMNIYPFYCELKVTSFLSLIYACLANVLETNNLKNVVTKGDNLYDTGVYYVSIALLIFEEVSALYYDEIIEMTKLCWIIKQECKNPIVFYPKNMPKCAIKINNQHLTQFVRNSQICNHDSPSFAYWYCIHRSNDMDCIIFDSILCVTIELAKIRKKYDEKWTFASIRNKNLKNKNNNKKRKIRGGKNSNELAMCTSEWPWEEYELFDKFEIKLGVDIEEKYAFFWRLRPASGFLSDHQGYMPEPFIKMNIGSPRLDRLVIQINNKLRDECNSGSLAISFLRLLIFNLINDTSTNDPSQKFWNLLKQQFGYHVDVPFNNQKRRKGKRVVR